MPKGIGYSNGRTKVKRKKVTVKKPIKVSRKKITVKRKVQ